MSYRLLAIPRRPAVSISSLPAFAPACQTLADVIRQPRASHNSSGFFVPGPRALLTVSLFSFVRCCSKVHKPGGCLIHSCQISMFGFISTRMSANNLPRNHSRTLLSYFSPVQLHPILKSFRLTAKRIHPCSTQCTMAGKPAGWEGASPQKTRGFVRVGVIGDLMSPVAGVATANLFSSLPTLLARSCRFVVPAGRNFPPRSCPPLVVVAHLSCLLFLEPSQTLNLMQHGDLGPIRSQPSCGPEKAAGWCCTVAQLACVSQDW